MKDLNLKTLNGNLNVEIRTDGGIGLYYEVDDCSYGALMLDKDHLVKVMGWLITYLESQKNG